jgi:hypothetical protein
VLIVTLFAAACGLDVGCRRPDADEGPWQTACHAHEKAPSPGDPAHRAAAVARWIEKNVDDADVRRVMRDAAQASTNAERARLLRNAAGNAGVSNCPVIEALWPSQ